MTDDKWTYYIYLNREGFYKVRVMRNGRQVDWDLAWTKWGARRKARRIKEHAITEAWSERGKL